MGLNVMRWPIRTTGTKKYEVKIKAHSLEGLPVEEAGEEVKLFVNVKWKGPWGSLGSRFGMKRPRTPSMLLGSNGVVEWDHDFENLCAFSLTKDGAFQSWPIIMSVIKPASGSSRGKPSIVGTILVDLGAFAGSASADADLERFPITCNFGGSTIVATLLMSIKFLEIRTGFEGFEGVHRLMAPAIACIGEPMWDSDEEKSSVTVVTKKSSALKIKTSNTLKKVALETDGQVSPSRSEAKSVRKVSLEIDGPVSPSRSEAKSPSSSVGSLQGSDNPFDSDSLEEYDVDDYVGGDDAMVEETICYGTLAGANLVAEEVIPFHREESDIPEVDDIMTVHTRATSVAISLAFPNTTVTEEAAPAPAPAEPESPHPSPLNVWNMLNLRKKRRINFGRSPRSKGEPLLNKAYGEEGGDEIDWDRRQADSDQMLLMSSEEGLSATSSNATEILDFGDEPFSLGSWERKDVINRDGQIKLSANVFFASFDQRSESAAGESACTALVAVIAYWLNTHPGLMLSKAEFDMLIRDGSAEWRKLCEVETYKESFPNRHFDLETVLKARVRPLKEVVDKSFVGYFLPERVEDLGEYDYLKGNWSFDDIWDDIERCGPAVYIVSWNDHFFVLRMEEQCCYIIDTLGERLYEGCNQAYILHFDETATLSNVPVKPKDSKESKESKESKDTKESKESKDTKESKDAKDSKDAKESKAPAATAVPDSEGAVPSDTNEKGRPAEVEVVAGETVRETSAVEVCDGEIVCRGRGACRQFVKRFFAGIHLREVELEAKKCAGGKSPQSSNIGKLQVEFHYVEALESVPASNGPDLINV